MRFKLETEVSELSQSVARTNLGEGGEGRRGGRVRRWEREKWEGEAMEESEERVGIREGGEGRRGGRVGRGRSGREEKEESEERVGN